MSCIIKHGMRLSFKHGKFSMHAYKNMLTGLICTVYWNHKPIFNLLMDKGYECASPSKFKHEWFGKRLRFGGV